MCSVVHLETLRVDAFGKTIIIEDDPAIRESIAEICRLFLNIDPLQAGSADEALAVLEGQRPAVVLLDLVLPGEGGEWVVQEIERRGWRDEVRVILMSAHADTDDTAQRLGVFGLLRKPFSLHNVTEVLQQAGAH